MELGRVFQKVDDFFDLFFGLVATCHIGKRDGVGGLIKQAGFGLAKAERAAFAAALHLTHEVHPHTNQQQHRAPADQQRHEQRTFFAGFDIKLHIVSDQVANQTAVQISGCGAHFTVVGGGGNNFGAALAFSNGGRFDALATHFF